MGHIWKFAQNSVVLDMETTRISNQILVNVSRANMSKLTLINCFLSTPLAMGEIHAEDCTITASTLHMMEPSSTLICCTVITKPNQSAAELSKYIHDKFNATSTNIVSFVTKEAQEIIKAAHDACIEGKVSALRSQFCLPATYYDHQEIIGTPTPLNIVATDGKKNITAYQHQQRTAPNRIGNDTPIAWACSSGIIPGIPLTTNERIFALDGGCFAVFQKVGILNEWTQGFLACNHYPMRLGTCYLLDHEPVPHDYYTEYEVGDVIISPTNKFIVGCTYMKLAEIPSGAKNVTGTITAILTQHMIATLNSMAIAELSMRGKA